MYHTNVNDLAFRKSTFSYAYERAFFSYLDPASSLMVKSAPSGRELLVFEGETEYIKRVLKAVETTLEEIEKEINATAA